MNHFQGLATHAAGAHLLPYKYDPGELAVNEVEVNISHCGICHSDIHLIDNDWQISRYPFIPGHEIVGTVTAVGSAVTTRQPGQRVGIGWQADSCGTCEWCLRGEEQLCPKAQPTCVGRNGGYADRIRANWRFAIPIPDALASDAAAPLLCAGITVYNPIRNLGTRPFSRVGIIGIGGLGHLALQFARAFGAEVTAFSTSPEKAAEAQALGAHRFCYTRETGALKKLAGCFDLILSTVNADLDWSAYIQALRPKGTLCFVGVPPSSVSFAAFSLVSGQRAVAGSPTGSPSDLAEMLDVAARHNVRALCEHFPMAQANEAVAKVKRNQIRFRAVLTN